jgi:hypothetical protein
LTGTEYSVTIDARASTEDLNRLRVVVDEVPDPQGSPCRCASEPARVTIGVFGPRHNVGYTEVGPFESYATVVRSLNIIEKAHGHSGACSRASSTSAVHLTEANREHRRYLCRMRVVSSQSRIR